MADIHLYATYLIIAVTIFAFATDRYKVEAVSIASLVAVLFLFGALPYTLPDGTKFDAGKLLTGFGNSALATVIALVIVGQGLFATDALDGPVRLISKMGRGRLLSPILIILIVTAVTSAFLNNTPVVVIFIPILAVISAQSNMPAYRIFMPLSFITILGGMTTLIGSSTNMIAAGIAAQSGLKIGMFDFTGMGVVLAVVGGIYVLFFMPRLLNRPEEPGFTDSATNAGSQFVGEVILTPGHSFIGKRARAGLFPDIKDLTPRLILRRDIPILPPYDDIELQTGDKLIVTGTRKAFLAAVAKGEAHAHSENDEDGDSIAPNAHYHLVEAVIAPGSRFAGRTIQLSGLQPQFNVAVFGVQRKSRMARTALAEIRLEAGDTLLIGGTMEDIASMRGNHDILLLEHSAEPIPQKDKANLAAAIFAGVVLLSAFEITPIVVNAIAGAGLMIATGCLTIQQATRAFDRQIYLLIGSSFALAMAMEITGGAALIAHSAVDALAGGPLWLLMSLLFLCMAIMTNILSNNAVAALFMPIALEIAKTAGAPPEAFAAAVIFAANCSFATPIGYQTNLLVMGPGHYRFSDFLKAGLPLVIILWLTFSILAPWYYGF
ncbi:SLC13 family permease [Rhizobium sp. L1K21]|uniref:SLC13 family permease n=1 Tax=Rhizobium sp. L1K21 TaxID=2954933 RepID=UPI00209238FE|nr:SLC13 family permease [Rhizobium sp. L1K21]MCO6186467.1 SLC13 family permease [Rhizobium sp. L1K21]